MTRQIQATDIHLPDRWMHRDGSAARCRGQHRGGIPSLGLAYLVSFEVAAAANSRQALVLHAYHCVSPVITPRGRRGAPSWRTRSLPILITDSRSPDDDPLTVARTSGFCTRRSERRAEKRIHPFIPARWNVVVGGDSWNELKLVKISRRETILVSFSFSFRDRKRIIVVEENFELLHKNS